MKLIVDREIFQEYPDLVMGVVVVKGADNSGTHEEVARLLRHAERDARDTTDIEPIKQYPPIAVWREAHKKFGSKPNRYAPSVEAVLKRVVKGGQLPSVNTLVDLYNVICLRYVVPVGGEDLEKCQGDIHLAYADGTENFVELGGAEQDPPEKGEVVYREDLGVICRRWNWREADRTKLTKQTTSAIIVVEGLPPKLTSEIRAAVEDLQNLVQQYCGGNINAFLINKGATEIEF